MVRFHYLLALQFFLSLTFSLVDGQKYPRLHNGLAATGLCLAFVLLISVFVFIVRERREDAEKIRRIRERMDAAMKRIESIQSGESP